LYNQIELRNRICEIVKTRYPDIDLYDKPLKQKFKTPAFFVYFRRVSSKDLQYLRTSTLNISIYYYGNDLNDLEDDYLIKETELNSLFKHFFQIKKSKILIENKIFVRDEDFLLLNFYIDIRELSDYKDEGMLIGEVKTKFK